jgi:hypothetical protein
MKSTSILMMATAAAILIAPCAQAQGVVVKVRVPFDFVVADQVLPSGEYQFVQQQDPRLVRIYSKAHAPQAIAYFIPMTAAPTGKASLVFHKYGNQRFLKMICDCGGSGAYLPKLRKERQAQARGESVLVATLSE